MQTLWLDLRYGARMLLKKPGFTLVAIITLSLGIGANTAIFSLVNTALLRPLPVERPEQLVTFNTVLERSGDLRPTFSFPNYRDLRDRNDVFASLAAYRFIVASLSHHGVNERVWGYMVTGNYFEQLGVKAALGRAMMPEDDLASGAQPVAVITHRYWQKRFGADPKVVGQSVIVNGHNYTIIGVMPPGFIGTEIAYAAEIWFPMMMQRQIEPPGNYLESRETENLFIQGRLKDGVTLAQAETGIKIVAAQLAREYPKENEGKTISLSPPGLFGSFMRGSVMTFAGVLMVVVGLVLLLACTNLANLLLARATERRKEIAIRLALGASRLRLVRQLLTESVLLATLGGGLGLLLAYWLVGAMQAFKPPMDIPLTTDLYLDYRVMLFTLGVSLLTGVVFGLLPALQSTHPDLIPALKDETSIGGYSRSWLRSGMVVLQISLSLVLLICAGLVLRGLQRAQFIRPGFVPQQAIELSFDLGLQGYDEARSKAFNRQMLDRVRALPGVEAAGLTDFMPLTMNMSFASIHIEGEPSERGGNVPTAGTGRASPGFREAMGIRLLEGRDFNEQDDDAKPRVALVNETFARRFWKNSSALGKRFSFASSGPWIEVVGLIEDGKYFSLSEEPAPYVYLNLRQTASSDLTLAVRVTREPRSVIADLRREFQQLDASLPIYNIKTLVEHMALPLFPARVAATLLGGFGLLALLLAAIGLFGVMSYAVNQRTREIGVRLALGASASNILKLVVGRGLWLTLISMILGLGAAWGGTRLLASLLYGVSAVDAMTFIGVSLLLLFSALLACWLPARRATKVDPMVALRHE